MSALEQAGPSSGRWGRDLALLCAATAALYAALCSHPLIGSYPRYVLSGREMVDSGDWVVPYLSYVPYLEKPILVYWFSAASQLLFGSSGFAIHLTSGIAALISVVCTYALGRKLRSPDFGLAAAAMLLVSGLFLAMSTVLTTDPLFACWLALAWLAYWLHDRGPGRGWIWLFWCALGLGWLTKGPLALVLVGVSLTGYFLLLGGLRALWREGRKLRPVAGLGVIALINVPWHWLVWQRDPRYLEMFYLRVNLRGLYDGSINHAGPFWAYEPMIAVALLPWTLVGLAALGVGLWRPLACAARERLAALRARAAAGRTPSAFDGDLERGRLYLACVFLFPLLFLSASASKLFTYLLPLLPAMILIVADVIAARAANPPAWLRRAVVAQAALLVLGFGGAWLLFRERLPLEKLRAEGLPLAAAALAVFLAGQVLGAAAVARRRIVAGFAIAGIGLALAICAVLPRLDRIAQSARAEELARKAAALAAPDDRFVVSEHCVQDYTIPLSLLRRCGVLGKARELAMGHFTEVTPTATPFPPRLPALRRKDLPQNPWLYDWNKLTGEWSEPRRMWYFGHFDDDSPEEDDARRLRDLGLPVYELGRVHDVALLTNQPVPGAN